MKRREFARQLRTEIEQKMADGFSAIPCDQLIAALRNIEDQPESEPDHIVLERTKSELHFARDSSLEMFRSVMSWGQNAVRSMFLLNGGAAVATLAFIGHLADVDKEKVAVFSECLAWFAAGVLFATLVAVVTYLTQFFYDRDAIQWTRVGIGFHCLSWIFGIGSCGLFAYGIYRANTMFAAF